MKQKRARRLGMATTTICRKIRRCVLAASICIASASVAQVQAPTAGGLNKPDRLEWLQDQGFGIFIHWSVDSQLGVVISHSLVDASPAYADSFFRTLPSTFAPNRFDADDLARLIKLSGARYSVFTTKHHSGFAMFSTSTTKFGVMNTPFRRDITKEILTALRRQDVATGIYFSPDDFHWLYDHHIPIARNLPSVQFAANPGLLSYDQQQLTELLRNYGPIDIVFFDGEPQGLRELAWKLQPNIVVTRGAIQTPEQYVPGAALPGVWEANLTMGTAWQYQPQHEHYKSGTDLIRLLIQTRARGGNLLLNVGPKPNGELPMEQEERLREIGLWMFVNSEAIYNARPWNITNEGDLWFTRNKTDGALYVIVDREWKRGEGIDIVLQSVRATTATKVSILGQNSELLEYKPGFKASPEIRQDADGLHIHAVRTQRLQDVGSWPNPAVIKLTNVEEAFRPPVVQTLQPQRDSTSGKATLHGTWQNPGSQTAVEVGFEYRSISGEDRDSRTAPWVRLPLNASSEPGAFHADIDLLQSGVTYEVRALVKHPLVTVFGDQVTFTK